MSYVVVCSSLISQVVPNQFPLSESQWACAVTVLVLPTVFIKQFSHIAWLSLVGVLALAVSAVLALVYEFQEIHEWDMKSLLFWDTNGVIIAFNIITFSYSIHVVVVPLAVDMADESKVNVALASSYSIASVVKAVFAVSGFLTYTVATNEVILNNLPAGIPTMLTAMFFCFNILLTFPIPALILLRNIEELSIYKTAVNHQLSMLRDYAHKT